MSRRIVVDVCEQDGQPCFRSHECVHHSGVFAFGVLSKSGNIEEISDVCPRLRRK